RGFDYAISFSSSNLNSYPVNITKVILEYNDSGTHIGISQGINSTFNWIGYDAEESNGAHSTPCRELAIKSDWNDSSGALPCKTVRANNINASAVGNYTNDASLRVKNAGKFFEWTGELPALRVAQPGQTPGYKHINWTRVD